MSSIVIQVGQCGNQLGENLFQSLYDATFQPSGSRITSNSKYDISLSNAYKFVQQKQRHGSFFRDNWLADEYEDIENALQNQSKYYSSSNKSTVHKRIPRALLIDTEPRVIDSCISRNKQRGWEYDANNAFTLEGGSGNNWAHGFYEHGLQVHDRVTEMLRSEAEKCDSLDAFVILQSVAGGTGSGLGTYLTGSLCDSFPNTSRINCVIWPHSTGEVVVHSYNTIFTMANLQNSSNAIVCVFLIMREREFVQRCVELKGLRWKILIKFFHETCR